MSANTSTTATDPGRDPDLDGVAARAIRDVMPLYLPTIPFSLVLGVAITESAMPTAIGYSSNLMFAGASQLATVTLAGTATWLTLVITASVINLRHVMYSAAMSSHFRDQPTWFRWVGPFVLIDQMFALTVNRVDMAPNVWRRYYMGAGCFLLVAWIIGVTLGMAVGSAIPTEWRLDVTPAVMFGGLVVMGISTRPAAAAAITGAAVCFACLGIPNNGGILLGAIAGVTAGFLADRAGSRRNAAHRAESAS
jgi:predicted branched-subunit amino acid permease